MKVEWCTTINNSLFRASGVVVGGALLRQLCGRAAVQHERRERARAALAALLAARVQRRQLLAHCLQLEARKQVKERKKKNLYFMKIYLICNIPLQERVGTSPHDFGILSATTLFAYKSIRIGKPI